MNYVLYVTNGCKSCSDALRFLEDNSLPVTVVNLSVSGQKRPEHVVIVPALFEEDRLLAYGPDIQRMFKQVNLTPPLDMSHE